MSLKVVLVSLLFTLNTDLPKGLFEYTCCIKQAKKLFKVNIISFIIVCYISSKLLTRTPVSREKSSVFKVSNKGNNLVFLTLIMNIFIMTTSIIHFQGLFQTITFGSDPLRVTASSHGDCGAEQTVSSLGGARCTTLIGSIDETPETMAVLGFLRPLMFLECCNHLS